MRFKPTNSNLIEGEQGSRRRFAQNEGHSNIGERKAQDGLIVDWDGHVANVAVTGKHEQENQIKASRFPPNKAVPGPSRDFGETVWTGDPIGVSVLISTRTVRKAEAKA